MSLTFRVLLTSLMVIIFGITLFSKNWELPKDTKIVCTNIFITVIFVLVLSFLLIFY